MSGVGEILYWAIGGPAIVAFSVWQVRRRRRIGPDPAGKGPQVAKDIFAMHGFVLLLILVMFGLLELLKV